MSAMRRKSQAVKELQETAKSEAHTGHRYETEIPKPPLKLSVRAKGVYYGLSQSLIEDKTYLERDHFVVLAYAKEYDLYLKLAKELNNVDDCIEVYKNGSNISGLFTAYHRVLQQMIQLMPQLGIGIKNRQNTTSFINQLTMNFDAPDPWAERAMNTTIDL